MQNRRNSIYILIILSLITGLFTGRASFFNFAYALVGLIVLTMFWSWLAVRWIGISRRTRASRTQVGRHLEEIFIIRNRVLIPKLWLEIRDHSNLPKHHAGHIVPALGARSSYRWSVQTLCLSRGEFRLGPMTISSGDPFGLFNVQRHIAASSRIIVYPATIPIPHFKLPMGMLSGGEAQRRRTHNITTNAAGVRDYVPGDSFNRIHWRSTARKNKLIVKEFEIDPLIDVWLFADFSRNSLVERPDVQRIDNMGPVIPTNGHIPKSTEEYIATISASLARHFVNIERAVGFAAYTPNRVTHQPERGNQQLTRILESLAIARSFSNYTLGQMLTLETPYFSRGLTLVVVTASIDKDWITQAQILNRRGIRIFCVLVDPFSFGGSEPSDSVRQMMQAAKVPHIVVRQGDDIATALTQHST